MFQAGDYFAVVKAVDIDHAPASTIPMVVLSLAFLDQIEEADRLVGRFLNADLAKTETTKFRIAAGILAWMKGDASAGLFAMEALIPYRSRPSLWVLEAKIWRGAMLADFGDFGAVQQLTNLHADAKNLPNEYLAGFALAALLFAKQRFSLSVDDSEVSRASAIQTPGLLALALRMAGVPDEALESKTTAIPLCSWRMPKPWIESHTPNLGAARDATDASIFPHLSDLPKMRQMACATCDNRCCYDGVYATQAEEDAIKVLRKKAPAYFSGIPEEFTEEGPWGFLFQGKRTKLRPHIYTKSDYPAHFGKTKCVLAMPNGECAPQRAGADLGYHPWRFKPSICWKFPLIGLFNDNAMDKPHYFGEPDPHAYDDTQRGYLSFLPCAVTFEHGVSWKQVYRHELIHFLRHVPPAR
jgi:hypothetical protein